MNTIFLVKNDAYQFLSPPENITPEWLHKLLGTTNLTIKKLHKNICIIHSSQVNKKYKVSIANKITTIVPDKFLLAQLSNDQLTSLSEQQEDYIIDAINIQTYK